MSTIQDVFERMRRATAEGRTDEAVRLAEDLAAAHMSDGAMQRLVAGALVALKRPARALELVERAGALVGRTAEVLHVRGAALLGLGRHAEAVVDLRAAVGLAPVNWDARFLLAKALHESGAHAESVAVCGPALEAMPGQPAFAALAINAGSALGDAGLVLPLLREAVRTSPENLGLLSGLASVSNALPDEPPATVFERHRAYGAALQRARPEPASPPPFDADPERRLRVALVSYDFKRHSSVAFFMRPMIEHLDRARFELIAYNTAEREDEATGSFRQMMDGWRHTPGIGDADLAARVRADRPDILIELVGHTATRSLGAFQPRCAPVQVSYLGYSNTTGMRSFDWRIVDSITDPAPGADGLATERLLRLDPCFLCYRPDADAPPPAAAPGLWSGRVTFGAFSELFKLNDRLLRLWGRVLAAAPGTRLLLKNRAGRNPLSASHLMARLARAGVDPARVELRAMTDSYRDHLAAYGDVDLALDTIPYNGTTTVCEALLMGTPILGVRPPPEFDRHAARVTMSLLTSAGLSELICDDEDDYVRRAAALASDASKLQAIRERCRPSFLASPICDGAAFGARFGAALRTMWRDRCARGV